MSSVKGNILTLENMDPHVKAMEFGFCEKVSARALEIEEELKMGVKKPFDEVIKANGGDCQALGQKPMTYVRQLLSLVVMPDFLKDPRFPEDAKSKARLLLAATWGSNSIGSYTDSPGITLVRQQIAKFIAERDGFPCNCKDVYVSSGTAESMKFVTSLLNARINGQDAGIMIPVPQCPLYTAALCECDIKSVGYYLNEEKNWALEIDELERSYREGLKHCTPRGIVIINPGNPTSNVLTKDEIKNIVKFAYEKKLFIFADEVYQYNIYDPKKEFHSFKKVINEMGHPYSQMELASFMSCSKGFLAECGVQGGYTELINMDPGARHQFNAAMTIILCTSALAQTTLYCLANQPKPGEPSYDLFIEERDAILNSLKTRARTVVEKFNSIQGISCQNVQGSLYAFPRIDLPPKAIAAAKANNQDPTELYALELLETTGICVVPGYVFKGKPGTYHLRVSILPQLKKLASLLEKFEKFHLNFLQRYS